MNKLLQKRLQQLKPVVQGRPSPVLDTQLANFPGERWKDIPSYEGQYQLSNYGRLKTLAHISYDKRGVAYRRPERIRKLLLSLSIDTNRKEKGYVQIALNRECGSLSISIRRYVYLLFVAAFDIKDQSLIVSPKDGNPFNCYYKNLRLNSVSEHMREGFSSGNRKSGWNQKKRIIHQYNWDGIYVCSYHSITEAAKATGIAGTQISEAAKEKSFIAGGYYWRYGKAISKINVSKYSHRRAAYLQRRKRKVQQLSVKGKLLRVFETVRSAARAVGASHASISDACLDHNRIFKGYYWRFGDEL
jgi:hypothetical protein